MGLGKEQLVSCCCCCDSDIVEIGEGDDGGSFKEGREKGEKGRQ